MTLLLLLLLFKQSAHLAIGLSVTRMGLNGVMMYRWDDAVCLAAGIIINPVPVQGKRITDKYGKRIQSFLWAAKK